MAEKRYTIQEQLGAGGNGAVFRAYDTQLKRRVAIKRLLSADEAASNDPKAEELRREADTLASLRNANIVTIFDVATDAEGLFMVMELLEGPDLSDAIAHGPLMYEDFKQLAEQTLEALLAAHNLRILHRDIKPENIKVERLAGGRLQAKIIDFGLARTGIAARKQTEDQEGSVMGSIYYMAPEQLSREPTDVRTDLYALGCVFYECLAGRKPFDGKTVNEVIDKHLDHDVNHLGQLCPHLPQWLTFWVMRLMACKPGDRPMNAQQAIEEFRSWEKLPSMPGMMMPWIPQGYGYAQPPVYTAPVQMPVYTGQVPAHTTGYYPVPAPPHITSSSVPVAPQPVSAPVPVAVLAASAAAPSAKPPRAAAPQRPAAASPRQPAAANGAEAKKKRTLIIGGSVVAVLLVFFMLPKGAGKKQTPSGTVAPKTLQIGDAPEDLYPPERAFPLPDTARVFQVTAKVATHGYLPDGKPSPKIDAGSIISVWEDVSKVGGNTPLVPKGFAQDASPERLAWNTTDRAIKDGRVALQFKSKSGKPVAMELMNVAKSKEQFPFGQEAIKNAAGITVAAVLQADDKQLPARLLKLTSEDGKSSVSLILTTNRAIEMQLMTNEGLSKISSSNVDATKPCIVIFTWDRATGDMKLRTRDQRGIAHTATGKEPAPRTALYILEVGSTEPDKAQQFSGKLAELVLLCTAQKDDQAALLDKELRDHYFNAAKPGSLNPGKNAKLADFPVGEERSIFNGRDLTGWDGSAKYWSVQDGALTVKGDPSQSASGNCNLTWKDGTVGDFELNLQMRFTGGYNTGIFYRAYITGRTADGNAVSGYQLDIDMGQKQRFGGLLENGVRNELAKTGQKVIIKDHADVKKAVFESPAAPLPDAVSAVAGLKLNEWNAVRIIADGNRLQHFINGKQIIDVTDEGHGRMQSGILGFEGQTKTGSTFQVKDVRVKRLR